MNLCLTESGDTNPCPHQSATKRIRGQRAAIREPITPTPFHRRTSAAPSHGQASLGLLLQRHLGTKPACHPRDVNASDHLLNNLSHCLPCHQHTFHFTCMNGTRDLTKVCVFPVAMPVQRSITTVCIELQGSKNSPLHRLKSVVYELNKYRQWAHSRTGLIAVGAYTT